MITFIFGTWILILGCIGFVVSSLLIWKKDRELRHNHWNSHYAITSRHNYHYQHRSG